MTGAASVAAWRLHSVPLGGLCAGNAAGHWHPAAPRHSRDCGSRSQPRQKQHGWRHSWRRQAAPAAGAGGNSAARAQQLQLPAFAAWPETARVALRTGIYITVLGLAVLLAPASTFGFLFDASRVPAGWVRVGGVLASLFGCYYVGAALDDAEGRHPRHLYTSTIIGRLLLSAAFAALVAARQCEASLLWLAAANAASSALLWRAARRRAAAEQAPPAVDQ